MLGLEHKIEKVAKKTAAFSAGGLLAIVGVGFLTSAAWILLAELETPLFAATTIGLAYVGLALIAFAYGMMAGRDTKEEKRLQQQAELSPMQMVAVSFIQGFERGRHSNRHG